MMKNNDEIKVGEYVRTNNAWGIRQVDLINENAPMNRYLSLDEYDHNDKIYSIIRADQIKKHSFNIMDLIEVGDYINGYKLCEITSKHISFEGCRKSKSTYYFEDNDFEIHDIVTHEQFDAMKYEVIKNE